MTWDGAQTALAWADTYRRNRSLVERYYAGLASQAKGPGFEPRRPLLSELQEDSPPTGPSPPRGEAAAGNTYGTRPTHGRHCPCSACAREDWTRPELAPCGMHGRACPPVYDPWPLDPYGTGAA